MSILPHAYMPSSGVVVGETSSTSIRFLRTNSHLLAITLFSICLSFSSPPLLKSFYKNTKIFSVCLFACLLALFEVAIMFEFVIAKSDDGKTPKEEISVNLDTNFFVMGSGNIIRKSVIYEFFTCT